MRPRLRELILTTMMVFLALTAGIQCGTGKRRSEQIADNPVGREKTQPSETTRSEPPAVKRPHPATMPAVPNLGIVTGSVVGYCIVSSSLLDMRPAMPIYQLQVTVKTSEDIRGMPNFTRDKVGEVIQLHSKKELSPDLFGKFIRARIFYRGDETGGKFWIQKIKVTNSGEQ